MSQLDPQKPTQYTKVELKKTSKVANNKLNPGSFLHGHSHPSFTSSTGILRRRR